VDGEDIMYFKVQKPYLSVSHHLSSVCANRPGPSSDKSETCVPSRTNSAATNTGRRKPIGGPIV
jgi:hypothetical protein